MSDELHDQLQRHAASVRGLARAMLRDPHAADDVAQQALTKAWTSKDDLQPGPLGGWLQRTVTNFTRQWQRSERRRTSREERHSADASPPHPPSPAEILARREALQSVTNAVLQLEEPYQTVVFLRYFEDLPPRTIASRTNSNVATVKSRLARGLAMLRTRMRRERGEDWRAAFAAAFGLPIGSVVIPVTTGVLVLKLATKAAAVAAICAGGLWLYDSGDPSPPPGQSSSQSARNTPATQSTADRAEQPEQQRTELVGNADDDSWLAHGYVMELHVHCIDSIGVPVKDYRPRLAPAHGALRYAEQATDEHGNATITFRSRQPRVEIEILDPRRHRRRIVLEHGKPTHVTMLDKKASGRYLVAETVLRFDVNSSNRSRRPVDETAMRSGLHPHARFSERALVPARAPKPERYEQAVANVAEMRRRVVSLSHELGSLEVKAGKLEVVAAGGCTIEGRVYDEDGAPCAKVPVLVFGSGPQPVKRGRTNERGEYRIKGLTAGEVSVRAGGEERGLGSIPVSLTSGAHRHDVYLKRDACIRGTLLDAAGKPIAGATVDYYADNGRWADRVTTDAEGKFLLANLPNQRGHLVAWAKDQQRRVPIVREQAVVPGLSAITIQAAAGQNGSIRVQPTATDGCDLSKLRLRVRHVDSGYSYGISVPRGEVSTRGADGVETRATLQTAELPWHQDHLPEGFYEVQMWLPGCGSVALGRHWIDGASTCDLGTVPLPLPGRLQFERPDTKQPDDMQIEIVSLRAPFDVHVDRLRQLDDELLLPPGEYALATRRGQEPPRFQRFRVESESITTLAVRW